MRACFVVAALMPATILACSSGEGTDPEEPRLLPPAPTASALILDDVTNLGNASDLEISFTRATDETRISEYRIIVVKSVKASSFRLADASAVQAMRYVAVAKRNQDIRVLLPANTVDSDGDVILEGLPYTAFVLSVADGVNAKENALSLPSNSLTAAQTTIKITFVADDGVVLTDGINSVAIDALPQTSTVTIGSITVSWVPAASGLLGAIQAGAPPWDNIGVALVTHDHPDHWFVPSATAFLASHSQARWIGPPQVVSQLAANPRIVSLNPLLQLSADTTVAGWRIRAYRMVHFDNFGLDFSPIQNLAYLVELGGKKILHLGDADLTSQNFLPFDFPGEGIDVVIVPAATVKLTVANIALIRSLIAADHILAAHLETGITEGAVKAVWGDDVVVFTESLQVVRY